MLKNLENENLIFRIRKRAKKKEGVVIVRN